MARYRSIRTVSYPLKAALIDDRQGVARQIKYTPTIVNTLSCLLPCTMYRRATVHQAVALFISVFRIGIFVRWVKLFCPGTNRFPEVCTRKAVQEAIGESQIVLHFQQRLPDLVRRGFAIDQTTVEIGNAHHIKSVR